MSRASTRVILAAVTAAATAAGCLVDDGVPGPVAMETKPETWDGSNDPRRFAADMERRWEVLRGEELRHGASEVVPWVDTYWPMVRDGYNQRWQGSGTLSPVELYDQAWNGWQPSEGFLDLRPFRGARQAYDTEYYDRIGPAATWAHEEGGNERGRRLWSPDGTLTRCDSDGDNRIDGEPEECDFDGDGEVDSGDELGGLEGWFGHCHAWAPAAFSVHEPLHAVEMNGVTFQVADIKALIEATYEGGGSVFLGGRCSLRDVERDEHGRITDRECRDTNAGAFHVVTLNVMGRQRQSFVIDATYGYEVWNQPVRDYTLELQEEVSEEEALALLGRTDVDAYPYNDEAERFVHVRMRLRYVVEGSASAEPYASRIDSYTRAVTYEYLLELRGDGEIVGGEWVDDNPHPDFMWAPTGNSSVREGGWGRVIIDAARVRELADLSRGEDPPPSGEEHRYSSAPHVAIPDNDQSGVSDTIVVEESLNVVGVRVSVAITHTYRGDLVVDLVHDGTTASLVRNEGGSADDLVRTFDVAGFEGAGGRGEWTLVVRDVAGQDLGTLNEWQLTLLGDGEEPPPPPPPPSGDEHVFDSSPSLAIPDDDPAGVTDTIVVEESLVAAAVTVSVDIAHTYRGDLSVSLLRGEQVISLAHREGGSADDLVATFELEQLVGADAQGEWSLLVVDGAARDEGTLRAWSVAITAEGGEEPPPPPPPPSGEERVFESTPGVAIPDAEPAGVTDSIEVPEAMTISALRVETEITHTWRGDLVVELVRGDRVVTLVSREGGSDDDLYLDLDVSDFQGEDAFGEWTLRVKDLAQADLGTLVAWRLVVTGS